eukprot:TRINITY_DN38222_c0_g1_i1.p1 TRINITY_DN38222_c0_g1~~TRINITY_DN38222_c0_g1_i1.p1  ORF type:complete len:1575 (-),score=317.75 TRINITY_DN38222_c0_g1_i1:94-4818(-)
MAELRPSHSTEAKTSATRPPSKGRSRPASAERLKNSIAFGSSSPASSPLQVSARGSNRQPTHSNGGGIGKAQRASLDSASPFGKFPNVTGSSGAFVAASAPSHSASNPQLGSILGASTSVVASGRGSADSVLSRGSANNTPVLCADVDHGDGECSSISLERSSLAPEDASVLPCSSLPSAKIRVVCRLRPMSDQERRSGTVPAITASTERQEVVAVRVQAERQSRLNFHFDHVLSSFSTQLDVFAVTLKPLVRDVLAGYEAAVFAYGQTGTGKTYTMEGELDSSERRGLVPRAAEALIRALAQGPYTQFSVIASCVEIYNEELVDLMADQQHNHKIELKETGHGVCCVGLSETTVSSLAEIQDLIRRAQEKRRVAETRLNARSSRSHSLFTLRVSCRQRVEGGEVEANGKLHLVDLAGSECARNSMSYSSQEACTKGERERRNINQSLLTLGRVIAALRDESSRVPYRDSKLTRLLQEALGGGCRTVMIATISPAQSVIDETISTLQYAEQATGIQNRLVQASHFRSGHLTPVGIGTETRCAGFGELEGAGTRADLHELEMRLEYLTQEVEEAHAAFEQKQREAQELHARVETAEVRCRSLTVDLDTAKRSLAERAFLLDRTADFADDRVEVVANLTEVLGVARRAHSAMCARLTGQREQVANLCATGSQRTSVLVGSARDALADVASACGRILRSQQEGTEIAESFIARQHQALTKLSEAVTRHGNEVQSALLDAACRISSSNTMNTSSTTASGSALLGVSTAAASGFDECSIPSLPGGCGLGAVPAAGAKTQAPARSTPPTRLLVPPQNLFSSPSEGGVGAAGTVSASPSGRRSFSMSIQLREPLIAHAEEAERLSTEMNDAKSQVVADAAAALVRRDAMKDAIEQVVAAQGSCMRSRFDPLRQAMQAVDSELATRSCALDGALNSVAAQLTALRTDLAKVTANGEAAVLEAIAAADRRLVGLRREACKDVANIRELLSGVVVELNAESGASAIGRHVADAQVALAEKAGQELAAITAARKAIADDVEALRRQLASERTAMAHLSRQRETMSEDVRQVQATLADVASEAASARSLASAVEEDQRRRRDAAVGAIMKGVEELIRTEMRGLEEGVASSMAPVHATLDSVSRLAADAGTAASVAERRAHESSTQAGRVVSALGVEAGSVCDDIEAAQDRAAIACRGLHATIGQVTDHLHGIAERGRALDAVCAGVADSLENAAGLTRQVESDQESLGLRWDAAREAAVACAREWTLGLHTADGALEVVATRHSEATQETASLRRQITSHSVAARDALLALASDEAHRSVALEKLAALQLRHSEDDSASAMSRRNHLERMAVHAANQAAASMRHAEDLSLGWQHASEAAETVCAAALSAQRLAAATLTSEEEGLPLIRAAASRVKVAQQESVVATKACASAVDGLASLPALWREGLACQPMVAFASTAGNAVPPDDPSLIEIPNVSVLLRKRPSCEEILDEYPRGDEDLTKVEVDQPTCLAVAKPTEETQIRHVASAVQPTASTKSSTSSATIGKRNTVGPAVGEKPAATHRSPSREAQGVTRVMTPTRTRPRSST